jgi:hypothetical protein
MWAKPRTRRTITTAKDLPFTSCASASKTSSSGAAGRTRLGNRQRDKLAAQALKTPCTPRDSAVGKRLAPNFGYSARFLPAFMGVFGLNQEKLTS